MGDKSIYTVAPPVVRNNVGHATRVITVLLANFRNDTNCTSDSDSLVRCPKYANWGQCRLFTNIGLTARTCYQQAIDSILVDHVVYSVYLQKSRYLYPINRFLFSLLYLIKVVIKTDFR